MNISPSQISTYLDCNFAAYVRYVERLVSVNQHERFTFGKAAHALLDPALRIHWASGGSEAAVIDAMSGDSGRQIAREAFAKVYEEDGVAIDDELARHVLAVVRWNLERMGLDEWTTLTVYDDDGEERPAVELHLECDLIPGVTLQGRIDWIAQHKTSGQHFVIDHKTTKGAVDPTRLVEHDTQLALYEHLCTRNEITVDGSMINLLRTKIPTTPPKIKSGAISRSQKIATDWETYERAIIGAGLDVDDYAEQRERLAGVLFRAYFLNLSSEQSLARSVHLAKHVATVRFVQDHEPASASMPNRKPTHACDACDYKAWCDATYDGRDPRSLLGSVYRPKDDSKWRNEMITIDTIPFLAFDEYEDRAARAGRFARGLFTP